MTHVRAMKLCQCSRAQARDELTGSRRALLRSIAQTVSHRNLISYSCGMIHSASGTTFTFNCGGLVGRYVNIVIPGRGKTLTLCEVEIFGSALPTIPRKGRLSFHLTHWLYTVPQLS